ncbi:hypothetical protein ES703_30782 [subsurface metagenome]
MDSLKRVKMSNTTIKRLKSAPGSVRNSKAVNKNMLQKRKVSNRAGVLLIEAMVAISIIAIVAIGAGAYRYYSTLDARKADVQVTAARFGWALLQGWKGNGGYSGYSAYEADVPADYDPNDYDPEYDYDAYDPAEYDYDLDDTEDIGNVMLSGPGLEVYSSTHGPPVPDGFMALDSSSNCRVVVNGVSYYATLSYKDEVGEPRVLNVSVAWMSDYKTWTDSGFYQSVTLTTYADD